MNSFEQTFFKKYIPEWSEIKWIIHEHLIRIIDKILLRLGLFVFVPSFLMYNSVFFQEHINFTYFEIYLIIIYLKIIYDIFNWYNDVWIITNFWVIDLDWSLLKTKTDSVNFENIEWVWVEQYWFVDKILNKWDIIIHKIWDEEFRLIDAKVPYSALNEIEQISNEIKENINKQKKLAEKTKFELILEALWQVVEKHLKEEWLKPEEILEKKAKKNTIKTNSIIEKISKQEWTIDLREKNNNI